MPSFDNVWKSVSFGSGTKIASDHVVLHQEIDLSEEEQLEIFYQTRCPCNVKIPPGFKKEICWLPIHNIPLEGFPQNDSLSDLKWEINWDRLLKRIKRKQAKKDKKEGGKNLRSKN